MLFKKNCVMIDKMKNRREDGMTTEKRRRYLKLILFTLLALSAFLILYFLFVRFGLGFKCVFNSITKLKCPGCGNTHAVSSLLHFHIKDALAYNYLFPLELFYILWVYFFSAVAYLKNGRFNYSPPFKPFDVAVLAALLIWFVARNLFHI